MATITGAGQGLSAIQSVFSQPFFLTINSGGTVITASNSLGTVTLGGSGFAYTSFVQNGTTFYQLTAGTINTVSYLNGSNQQTWSGLNVSAVDASNDLLNSSAFNNLFFSGDDTFTWSATPSTTSVLFGLGGNDTFNVVGWDNAGFGAYEIDGGTGTNTLNIDGGIGGNYGSPYLLTGVLDLSSGNTTNFNVTNIQTINLTGGVFFTILASASLDPAGSTVTVNGSALGATAPLIFNTNLNGGTNVVTGNLVLLGGAGNDTFEGGTGNTVFNGGGGYNTVSFMWGLQRSGLSGVTADLSNTGTQNFGAGWGTGSFTNIQNLIGTPFNDTLTGDANDNVFEGEGGNDTINGGSGYNTAIFANPLADYTITHSGRTVTIAGPEGTDTLTNVEEAKFSDLPLPISGPVVTTQNVRLAAGQSIPVSDYFVSGMLVGGLEATLDIEGAPITEYQLWDGSSDPGAGYFTLNGVAQPAHTVITISAAQLAQANFVGGTIDTELQIRAYDGYEWSAPETGAWSPFIVGPGLDHAPVVTTTNLSEARNQTMSASSLFTVTDADNDTITEYQLWDSSSALGSGYFTINGVAQPAHTVITISAAQLAQTNFFTGSGSANNMSTSLQIRAFDGYEWSAADNASWAPFTVSVPADNPPVVSPLSIYTEAPGQTLSLSYLAPVSDVDGDAITEYQLWDSTGDPNAGYWVVNGVAQPAHTIITISAAQAALTTFVTGSVATSLQVRASDGILWSAADDAAWAPFTVSPPQDLPPVVETGNVTAPAGQTFTLGNLAVYISSNPVAEYQLWESTRDPNAGYFIINGVRQSAGTVITVTAAQVSQTTFVAGSVATSLQIRASDGILFSAADNANWGPFTVSPPPPVVSTGNQTVAASASVALSSLFSVSDPNGNAITEYQLWDSSSAPGSGYFTINGVTQPAHTVITISAGQLAQTDFFTGTAPTSLQIRAYDGVEWSAADNAAWAPFTVTPQVVQPPMVITGPVTATPGQTLALSSLFTVSDPNGDTITRYELWESSRDPRSGQFYINGVAQPAGTVIDITAAQLSQTTFVAGQFNADLQIRAYDGYDWSAAANASWAPFKVVVDPSVPQVTGMSITATHGQTVPLSSLFSVYQPDGDPMQEYQVDQTTNFTGSGYLVVNGVVEPAQTVITIPASELAQSYFVGASIPPAFGASTDNLQISAFDGSWWSQTTNSSITVQPDSPPVVTTSDVTEAANTSVALSSLFTVTDADGDTMTKYELWESTRDPNAGHFVINGVAEPAGTVIDITAAQLAQTSFLTGTISAALQIRAFDGIAWSAADNASWAPFHVNIS